MKQEALIAQAIERTRAEGILIRRGAHFDWTIPVVGGIPIRSVTPTSCNATGAVLWAAGRATEPHQLKILCDLLDVDTWWLYRFWVGFDRNHQILIMDEDNKITGQDEISKMGIRIGKKYVRNNVDS